MFSLLFYGFGVKVTAIFPALVNADRVSVMVPVALMAKGNVVLSHVPVAPIIVFVSVIVMAWLAVLVRV